MGVQKRLWGATASARRDDSREPLVGSLEADREWGRQAAGSPTFTRTRRRPRRHLARSKTGSASCFGPRSSGVSLRIRQACPFKEVIKDIPCEWSCRYEVDSGVERTLIQDFRTLAKTIADAVVGAREAPILLCLVARRDALSRQCGAFLSSTTR